MNYKCTGGRGVLKKDLSRTSGYATDALIQPRRNVRRLILRTNFNFTAGDPGEGFSLCFLSSSVKGPLLAFLLCAAKGDYYCSSLMQRNRPS
jgi:hypothetical protein